MKIGKQHFNDFTKRELAALFPNEYKGNATASDFEQTLVMLGVDRDLVNILIGNRNRPMLFASDIKNIFSALKFTDEEVESMVPKGLSGNISISGLMQVFHTIATDYTAPTEGSSSGSGDGSESGSGSASASGSGDGSESGSGGPT